MARRRASTSATEALIRQAVARGHQVTVGPAAQLPTAAPPKRPKYGNRKCEIDGVPFDSQREARRYLVLRDEQRAGLIEGLRLQVPYTLEIGGVLICRYVADFAYRRNGAEVVEDAKGTKTPVYRLKKKLMRAILGITIQEV